MASHLRRTLPCFACSIAIVAAPLVGASTPPATDALTRELVATSQAMMDALASGKADVWQRALADDAVIVDEFGRVQDKAAAVAGVTGLPPGFSGDIRLLDPKLHVYGDTAVLVVDADEYETVFGQKLHVLYRMTCTFVQRDGGWQLAALHEVTVPTTPPALDVAGLVLDDYTGVYRYAPGHGFSVRRDGNALSYTTRPGRPATRLLPLARDVFMDDGDEKNLYLFRRDAGGKVDAVIERRKFNDLRMARDAAATP